MLQERIFYSSIHLKLSPGMSLLDLGAGRGWPGVYVTQQSSCRTVLTDVPAPALGLARSNAIEHGVGERCLYAAADGRALPFTSGVFEAVIHADVLC